MTGWLIAACIVIILLLAIITFCLFINHSQDNRTNGVYRNEDDPNLTPKDL